jgi:peptidoglycan/xylan/chitin deacetylase (PgdA/CDA1 family)
MRRRNVADVLVQALLRMHRASRLGVLIYHRVLPAHDPLRPSEPTGVEFEARMRFVKANFNVISLADGVAGLKRGRLPARALAITFDDGYRDNYDIAMPILVRLGLPAAFFVATGYLDGGRMFNDTVIEAVRQAETGTLDLADLGLGSHAIATGAQRRAAANSILDRIKYLPPQSRTEVVEKIAERVKAKLPDDLMMTSEHVAAMHRAGMEVGGHTVGHPILAEIDLEAARHEIVEGRARLEHIVGTPLTLFAYPNGRPRQDYTSAHVGLVRELGFDAAVSTAWGAAKAGADLFQIPRFTPWDRQHWKFGLRIARTLFVRNYAMA